MAEGFGNGIVSPVIFGGATFGAVLLIQLVARMFRRVAPSASAPAASGPIFYGECGSRNPRGAKFCAECGEQLNAPAG